MVTTHLRVLVNFSKLPFLLLALVPFWQTTLQPRHLLIRTHVVPGLVFIFTLSAPDEITYIKPISFSPNSVAPIHRLFLFLSSNGPCLFTSLYYPRTWSQTHSTTWQLRVGITLQPCVVKWLKIHLRNAPCFLFCSLHHELLLKCLISPSCFFFFLVLAGLVLSRFLPGNLNSCVSGSCPPAGLAFSSPCWGSFGNFLPIFLSSAAPLRYLPVLSGFSMPFILAWSANLISGPHVLPF